MAKFNVGDKVRIKDQYAACGRHYDNQLVLTIREFDGDPTGWTDDGSEDSGAPIVRFEGFQPGTFIWRLEKVEELPAQAPVSNERWVTVGGGYAHYLDITGKHGKIVDEGSMFFLIEIPGWTGGHDGAGYDRRQKRTDRDWLLKKDQKPIETLGDLIAPKAPVNPRADRAAHPVNQTILRHLKRHKTISPMEALGTYCISRLAPAIHDLRAAGHRITTDIRKDARGHRYARYTLSA